MCRVAKGWLQSWLTCLFVLFLFCFVCLFFTDPQMSRTPERFEFDPDAYGPVVASLIGPWRDNRLDAGTPDQAVYEALKSLSPETLAPEKRLVDRQMASACCAGLWLYHDFLDASHKISQQIKTPTGSFWHGIMHRREGDYGNAKYWFRNVGSHEVFPQLHAEAVRVAADANCEEISRALGQQACWDPFAFVDWCEAVVCGGRQAWEPACRRIQACEWQLLFDYCFRHAFEVA